MPQITETDLRELTYEDGTVEYRVTSCNDPVSALRNSRQSAERNRAEAKEKAALVCQLLEEAEHNEKMAAALEEFILEESNG
jgi:hypothetical protein